jgi:hypothetical protein
MKLPSLLAIATLLFTLYCVSCQGESQDPASRAYMGHLEGKVGKKDSVSIDVLLMGTSLRGYVSKGKDGKPMEIKGSADLKGFSLQGEDPRDQAGSYSGTPQADGKGFKGSWTSADGTRKEAFSAAEPINKPVAFTTLLVRDADPDGGSALCAMSEPSGASKEFLKAFRAFYFSGKPLKDWTAEAIDSYRIARAIRGDAGIRVAVRYLLPYRNSGGYLSLFDVEERSNNGVAQERRLRLRTWNAGKGRLMVLADILKPGKAGAMDEALTATVRLTYSLGPEGSLKNLGFYEENVKAVDSFGLAASGILFHFPAGEIALASLGDIQIFLPVSRVSDVVKAGIFPR